jgi:hypothetical protein
MPISAATLQGKRVISYAPMMLGSQSVGSTVSTNVEATNIVQFEIRTPSQGLGQFYIFGEDRVFRQRSDDQPTCTVISDAALFQQLVSQWRKERGATSSITRMAMCLSYQRIIGMGEKAIPLILRQLEDEGDDPDHWFWALQALTRENPVPEDARGDMKEMARAWLDWAYMAGYDW